MHSLKGVPEITNSGSTDFENNILLFVAKVL